MKKKSLSVKLLSLLIAVTLCIALSAVPVSAQGSEVKPKLNEEGKWIRMHSDPEVFKKNYTLSTEQKMAAIKKCEYVASRILDPQMSDLEKYYTLAIWLNKNVSYDWDLWNGGYDMDFYTHQWDAYGVLKEKKSICAGIAVTYANLCHAADLPCKFVRMDPAVLDHTINYIPDINGHAYYIDVTENIFFMSDNTNPWDPLDLKFSHIPENRIPDDGSFDYMENGALMTSTIKEHYNTQFTAWYKEYALHQNTKKVFKTKYVEKGSGRSGEHYASYKDYPRQFSDTENPVFSWFMEDFYADPEAISNKILNKEFDDQLLYVSGLKGSYDCDTADKLAEAVRADMTVNFFPSSEGGEVVAKEDRLTDGTDYEVACKSFDETNGEAVLTITGTGEYSGEQEINVRFDSAVVTKAPVSKMHLVYNGSPQALAEAGDIENGTILYAACKKDAPEPDPGSYKPDIPAATNAGKYDVWYKVEGDEGYFDVQPQKTESVAVIAPFQSKLDTNITIKVGQTVRLSPAIDTLDKARYSFMSYDDIVAKVSKDGTVTGLTSGYAMIVIIPELTGSNRNIKKPETIYITVRVTPADNPMTLKAKKTAKVWRSKIRKKAQIIKRSKVIEVKKARGKLAYQCVSVRKGKKNYRKYFKINAKTGDVTVKKGLKKGTYKVKVKVRAAGNNNYKASSWKSVTFKVRVK